MGLLRPKTAEELCRDYQEACLKSKQRYGNNPITKITLDITPPFSKGTYIQAINNELEKAKQLDQSEARTWTNQDGETVAVGKVKDFRKGVVVIDSAEDGEVTIPLGELSVEDICHFGSVWGIPFECTISRRPFLGREWTPATMTWKASALCHKPLYAQDVQLERYGHTSGPFLQPVVSGAHFFASLVTTPYQMGINPPHECRYALGFYRPGSCAPWLLPPVPISLRGALLQAGVVTGAVYVIP